MISFRDLKVSIIKSAKSQTGDNNSNFFAFEIDSAKLEKNLRSIDPNLYVMALSESVSSHVPDENDIQFLVDYLHREQDFNAVLSGDTQICKFMVFAAIKATPTENGVEYLQTSFTDEDGNPVSDQEIFNKLNTEDLDMEFVKGIIKSFPLYQILVYKVFNNKKDKFEYKINIRSNYEMVSWYRSTGESQDNSDDTKSAE